MKILLQRPSFIIEMSLPEFRTHRLGLNGDLLGARPEIRETHFTPGFFRGPTRDGISYRVEVDPLSSVQRYDPLNPNTIFNIGEVERIFRTEVAKGMNDLTLTSSRASSSTPALMSPIGLSVKGSTVGSASAGFENMFIGMNKFPEEIIVAGRIYNLKTGETSLESGASNRFSLVPNAAKSVYSGLVDLALGAAVGTSILNIGSGAGEEFKFISDDAVNRFVCLDQLEELNAQVRSKYGVPCITGDMFDSTTFQKVRDNGSPISACIGTNSIYYAKSPGDIGRLVNGINEMLVPGSTGFKFFGHALCGHIISYKSWGSTMFESNMNVLAAMAKDFHEKGFKPMVMDFTTVVSTPRDELTDEQNRVINQYASPSGIKPENVGAILYSGDGRMVGPDNHSYEVTPGYSFIPLADGIEAQSYPLYEMLSVKMFLAFSKG